MQWSLPSVMRSHEANMSQHDSKTLPKWSGYDRQFIGPRELAVFSHVQLEKFRNAVLTENNQQKDDILVENDVETR